MALTKSEAGKLGAAKSNKLRRLNNEAAYLKNPKFCRFCKKVIDYASRSNSFCGHVCAASHTYASKPAKTVLLCTYCGASIQGSSTEFCSRKCQQTYILEQRVAVWDSSASAPAIRTIKRWLVLQNNSCFVCGISSWNGKPIVLDLEHKNGDSTDNSKENVCLICPNCHSQTTTYKGANRCNGRYIRRQRYAEGKSW